MKPHGKSGGTPLHEAPIKTYTILKIDVMGERLEKINTHERYIIVLCQLHSASISASISEQNAFSLTCKQ